MRVMLLRIVDGKVEGSVALDGGPDLQIQICSRCHDLGDCREVNGETICRGCATPEEVAEVIARTGEVCDCPKCSGPVN